MKIGIALAGSAARGIAHLGILQALEEVEIKADRLTGVSSGALVGALYADGYSPKRILSIVSQQFFLSFLSPSFFQGGGLLRLDNLEKLLRKYLRAETFEELNIPLTVSATDLHSGESVCFDQGELVPALLASCCLPMIFTPVSFQGRTLVDGGLVNTLLVEPLQKNCDFIIGSHTNPLSDEQNLNTPQAILQRCLRISIHANARAGFPLCDWVIEPHELENYAPFRFDQGEAMFKVGYEHTLAVRDEILHAISQKKLES